MDKAQAAYDWLAPKLSSIERESLDSIMAALAALREENARLREEAGTLRLYGNKDCTAMADAALASTRPVPAQEQERGETSISFEPGKTLWDEFETLTHYLVESEICCNSGYCSRRDSTKKASDALYAIRSVCEGMAQELSKASTAPAQEQGADMRAMLERLVNAEAHYRTCHDHHGDSDIRTGMAWDSLRKRGDEARALLAFASPVPSGRWVNSNKCAECGASYGLHRFETEQCPRGGVEAPLGRSQEYEDTTFRPLKVWVEEARPAPAQNNKADPRFIDLAAAVLKMEAAFYDDPYGPFSYQCPLCGELIYSGKDVRIDGVTAMKTIQHSSECAYRIANDLASTVPRPAPAQEQGGTMALLADIANFGDPDGQRGMALAKVRQWAEQARALLARKPDEEVKP